MRFLETKDPDSHSFWAIVFFLAVLLVVLLLNSCSSVPCPPCHCPPVQPPEVIHVPVPDRPIPLPTPAAPALDLPAVLDNPAPEQTKRILVALRHDLGELWRAYTEALETIRANNDSID